MGYASTLPRGTKTQSHVAHYLVVAAGIAMCFGPSAMAFSCAGIFYTPVSKDLGVGKGTFAIYMTVLCLTMFFALSVAGKILAKVDARLVLSLAVAVVSATLFAMGLFTTVWQFYVAGFFLGLGESFLLYLAVPTLINRWFKQRVGFFVGLCMAFTGIGGVVFNPILGAIIDDRGWRTAYHVAGVLALVIALPFTLFGLRSQPSDKGLRPYGEAAASEASAPAPAVLGVSASKAFRTPVFAALLLFAGLCNFGTVIYQFMPSYASSLPLSKTVLVLAATLASAAMLGQALGKVGLGIIADKSLKGSLVLSLVCGAVGLVALWLVDDNEIAMYGGGFLFGIFYASALVIVPLIVRLVFGSRDYADIYSKISMAGALMAAFAAAIWGYIIDLSGYTAVFLIGLALMVVIGGLGFYALAKSKGLEHTAA